MTLRDEMSSYLHVHEVEAILSDCQCVVQGIEREGRATRGEAGPGLLVAEKNIFSAAPKHVHSNHFAIGSEI